MVDQVEYQLFIDKSSELLTAMANASRIEILSHLMVGEISVGRLSEKVGLSQSALSQHLAKLRAAGLVSTRRDSQTVYYFTQSAAVAKILSMLQDVFEDSGNEVRRLA